MSAAPTRVGAPERLGAEALCTALNPLVAVFSRFAPPLSAAPRSGNSWLHSPAEPVMFIQCCCIFLKIRIIVFKFFFFFSKAQEGTPDKMSEYATWARLKPFSLEAPVT